MREGCIQSTLSTLDDRRFKSPFWQAIDANRSIEMRGVEQPITGVCATTASKLIIGQS